MSVYKRGDTWWIKYHDNGRIVRRSAKTASKREAQALERTLRARTGSGDSHTYLEALTVWLDIAPKSMLSHARNTHEIYSVPLSRLPAAANRMGNRMLKDGLSVQTVNRRLAVVRRVLNLAFKEWDMLDKPLAQRISLHSEKGTERLIFLSADEVVTLVNAMQNEEAREFALTSAYTGLRRGEVFKLTPDNWHPPYIILSKKTKSGKPRSVPVMPELNPVMGRLPFTLTPHELRKDFEQARKAVGMSHVRLHDLRHTFASWLISNPSISMGVIRDLLGHSSLAVTSKYAHLRNDTAEMVFSALGHIEGHTIKPSDDD